MDLKQFDLLLDAAIAYIEIGPGIDPATSRMECIAIFCGECSVELLDMFDVLISGFID